jgi:23S rRNA (uracil1939-C5)-methyltransferase
MRRKNIFLENVAVTDLGAEGKAIAKLEGKVFFIEGAIPGDIVNIQITKSKKDWAEAKVTQIIKPSEKRAAAFCKHFGNCGGCKWQMLPYALQLEYKQNEVLQNLKRLGKVTLPELSTIVGSTEEKFYRNKLEFTFSNKRYRTKDEISHIQSKEELYNLPIEPALGYHVPKLFDKVLDIDECFLMQEPTNAIRNEVRRYSLEHGLPFYDIKNHTGWLRNLMIRVVTTGDIMVNFIIAYDDIAKEHLLNHIQQQFPQITSLLYTVNAKMNDSIFDLEPQLFSGKKYIIEKLYNEDKSTFFQYKISAKSFFQTNTKQAEKLYQITHQFAELTGSEIVYDLYCGTGSIGIFCSPNAKKIIGIELIEQAIEDAKENAQLNNVQHAAFFAGDVISICDDAFINTHGKPDVVITDPPRAGMHAQLVHKILEMEAPIVVYVSCNSATQARDLQLLDEKYIVTKVQPVDMFPHTHHIENVVQLKLRNK